MDRTVLRRSPAQWAGARTPLEPLEVLQRPDRPVVGMADQKAVGADTPRLADLAEVVEPHPVPEASVGPWRDSPERPVEPGRNSAKA